MEVSHHTLMLSMNAMADMKAGGHAICPGRFLAKSAILVACALMVENFDMEMATGEIEMSYAKFGLGTLRPKNPIPFRLRRRLRHT
jgi:hypothetical protein